MASTRGHLVLASGSSRSENGNLKPALVLLQRVHSELFVLPFVYMCHDLGGGQTASFRLDELRIAASLTRAKGLRCRF